jgi:long-chain fatty acid transport protein
MNKTHALLGALFGACAFAQAGNALAGGFQALEQNASGLGTAYAGSAAIADNASTLYYNPAGMTLLPARQVSLGVVGVLDKYSFDNHGSSGATGGNGGDAGQWRGLPNAYLSWAVQPDWVVGLGISSPNSLHNDYDRDWRGRAFALEAEVRSVNFNPSLAYKVSDRLSLGFGLDYQHLKLDTAVADPAGGSTRRSDSDNAWGWNAGALFTLSPAMRLGLAYRSEMEFDLGRAQAFPGVSPSGKLKTPGTFTLSVWQQVSDRWEAMGDLAYTHWKALDNIDHDGWRLAWGAAYKYNEAWKSKFGIAYEHSFLSDGSRTAMLPDARRIWLSIGGQYKPSKDATLDFGYAYRWVGDSDIDQRLDGIRLRGDYDASGHVLGVQYTQNF